MIPFILAGIGGYLLGDSLKENESDSQSYKYEPLKMAKGGLPKGAKIRDYNGKALPSKVFGNVPATKTPIEYKGLAVIINGYNGYESTWDDGLLAAIVNDSAFKNGKPNLLKDQDGFYIMKKGARGSFKVYSDELYAKGGTTSDCGCQKMENGGKVSRKCKSRYDDGGKTTELEIEFDENDPRMIGVEYSIKKNDIEYEISGTLRPYHTGKYEFEPGYFQDEETEKYYSENWETIEEQILDAFYKN